MKIKREIGEKGQIVIPKDIRDNLGLNIGVNITFEVEDDKVIIKKEKDPNDFLKDFLNVPKVKRKLSIKDLKKAYEEQYDERIH